MSLSVDGVWKVGVWAQTVWATDIWREGDPPNKILGGTNMGFAMNETQRVKMAYNPTDIDRDYVP
jgi:hypothetical protein